MLDRVIEALAPGWALARMKARGQLKVMQQYYEAGMPSRRTDHFRRLPGDANAVSRGVGWALRAISRDMRRNNAWAAAGLAHVAMATVGGGIVAQIKGKDGKKSDKLEGLYRAHAETTEIDADGLHNIYGQQRLAIETIAESGEVLVRRRWRRPIDNLALPFQFQVLDPDYIDSMREGDTANGGRIIQGVQFSPTGQREGYWLFRTHPGDALRASAGSYFVPAVDVLHLFRVDRPGQVRGVPWLAPALIRLHDLHDYENAQLMRQKIAACFAAFEIDSEGSGASNGQNLISAQSETGDETIGPGAYTKLPPGRSIVFAQPPQVGDYDIVLKNALRQVAAALRISYESLTGDLSNVNFSSGRMGKIKERQAVAVSRQEFFETGFNAFYAESFLIAARLEGIREAAGASFVWTPPREYMINPSEEVRSTIAAVRGGLKSWQEAARELGYDPAQLLAEIAETNGELDRLNIILDSDPRRVTQAGNPSQMQTQETAQ